MKTVVAALGAAVLMSGATAAHAQGWTSINQRQRLLDDRIDAGVRSRQLTAQEASRLRADFDALTRRESRYRRSGLSAWERSDLDRRFDRLQDRIHDQRRDRQIALGWFGGRGWTDRNGRWVTIDERQRELDRRIDRGLDMGRLTPAEARRLRDEYRDIARLETRYRRGRLTAWETSDLDRRFDRLADRVRWQAHDSQVGYGYGWRR